MNHDVRPPLRVAKPLNLAHLSLAPVLLSKAPPAAFAMQRLSTQSTRRSPATRPRGGCRRPRTAPWPAAALMQLRDLLRADVGVAAQVLKALVGDVVIHKQHVDGYENPQMVAPVHDQRRAGFGGARAWEADGSRRRSRPGLGFHSLEADCQAGADGWPSRRDRSPYLRPQGGRPQAAENRTQELIP